MEKIIEVYNEEQEKEVIKEILRKGIKEYTVKIIKVKYKKNSNETFNVFKYIYEE